MKSHSRQFVLAGGSVAVAVTWGILLGIPPASRSVTMPAAGLHQNSKSATYRALTYEEPSLRVGGLRRWAGAMPTSRMADAMAEIESMRDGNLRLEACRALLTVWCQRDAKALAHWFESDGTNAEIKLRMEAREVLLQLLLEMTPQEALEWLEASVSARGIDLLKESFFRQWAAKDPVAACNELSQTSDGDLLGQIAAQWATADLNGAVKWVKEMPESPLKRDVMREVSYYWAKVFPLEAAIYAAEDGDAGLLLAVSGQWANSAPQDAADWVAGWPAGHERDATVKHVSNIWAQNDPAAAAAYAAHLPEGETQDLVVAQVVNIWAYHSPRQAADWGIEFPESSTREIAIKQLVSAWATSKPQEVGQWLSDLPISRSTDIAVVAYSKALAEDDPELAFQWAETIGSDTLRHGQVEQVAIVWMRKDPANARNVIVRSALPSSIKEQLLAPPVPLP